MAFNEGLHEFQTVYARLLREAGVRPRDLLVGVWDGAPWAMSSLRLHPRQAWLRGERDSGQ